MGTSSMRLPLIWCDLPPSASRAHAAVNEDGLPGDEACSVRDQKEDDVGDVLRLSETSERRVGDRSLDALGVLVHIGLCQRSLDDARADGVYVDAQRAPLD